MIHRLTLILLTLWIASGCSVTPTVEEILTMQSQKVERSLSGSWYFRQVGAEGWLPATVPGTVHTDLWANSLIENPNYPPNEEKLQWIEHEDWEYTSVFYPTSDFMNCSVQKLHFKGLDTYAEVFLNNESILIADNMFREWEVDLSGKLKYGENRLLVRFTSTIRRGMELLEQFPIKLPADNDRSEDEKVSPFVRKSPYHFGWDWAPRYVTMGIWRELSLEGYSLASIESIQYVQKSQSPRLAEFDANLTLHATKDTRLSLLIIDTISKQIYAETVLELIGGKENYFTIPFSIDSPKLWYPNGMGEPHLYPLSAVLVQKNEKLDQVHHNIGVRTIRLIQEQEESIGAGESFYFEVNGERTFAKGANYVPQRMFLPTVTDQMYIQTIQSARKSNMNMVRVWGGGIYEDDRFYELCDENGIMVWQDFIFSCSFYPWDDHFLESVRQEATDNIRRLRNHPSIALWCGNNEIEEAWNNWGYQKRYQWTPTEQEEIYNGMQKLFAELLPAVLSKEDTTRSYHKSSPTYGRGNPKSKISGDMHYWGVFHDEKPFSSYRFNGGRFSSEYGFQSFPCYDTYREQYHPDDLHLYSSAVIAGQKNARGFRLIEQYMAEELPLLKDDFRNYIYLSQLLQAEGVKIAMESHRIGRPYTEGSLYWQLNDCSPFVSWSSIDYAGRWKALQFYAKRSFAPILFAFDDKGGSTQLKLWGISDLPKDIDCQNISIKLMDFSGQIIWQTQLDKVLTKNSNTLLFEENISVLLGSVNPSEVFLVVTNLIDGKPLRAIHYFVPLKDLKLPAADYEISYSQESEIIRATIRANTLLKSVLLESDIIQYNPSDAYFDLLPGEEREIILEFKEDRPIDELGIKVTTLNNLVGKKPVKPIKEDVI